LAELKKLYNKSKKGAQVNDETIQQLAQDEDEEPDQKQDESEIEDLIQEIEKDYG